MSNRDAFARSYIDGLCTTLKALPIEPLGRVLEALEAAHRDNRTVFLAGNGGSAATASHMANDLVWGLVHHGGRGLRAISLGDGLPLLTAVANDAGYHEAFIPGLRTLARKGDVLLVITGSGNSPNILRALEVAKEMDLRTIGFLGMDGGKAARLCDISVIVPSTDYGPIEDIHMALDHLITAYLREATATKGA